MTRLTLAILPALVMLIASTASAEHPQSRSVYVHSPPGYVVLQAPSTPHNHHHARHLDVRAAAAQPVYRQPYAYGWFGAQPRRHWNRHFGYHRNFTQWSAN